MSDEQFESDANDQESPSEIPESSTEDTSQEVTQETQAEQSPEPVPFHEDPKVQEYIQRQTDKQMEAKLEAQREQYDQEFSKLRSQYEQVQQSLPKPEKPSDPMIERMKQIDPEFGKYLEDQNAKIEQFEELQEWRQNQQAEQMNTRINSSIKELHTENSVPSELQEMYDAQIFKIAQSNPNLKESDLPKVYNQVHQQFVNVVNAVRRSERESYVNEKKAVSKAPPASKGEPVSPGKSAEFSKDPEARREQAIQRILKQSNAEGDI